MSRADLLRERAAEYELRARALSDATTVDPAAAHASDVSALVAVVLLELGDAEDSGDLR